MALPKLYPSYALNPLLNKEKLFQFTPPASIDSNSPLPPLPSEWLAELENFCRKQKSDLTENCFNRHLAFFTIDSVGISMSPSISLTEGLELIYRRLQGDLDHLLDPLSESDRMAIIAKLIEDIDACTDGFKNRVKHITTAFEIPGNLPQLIYQVRKGLVENVSASLTGEIHAWNRATKVAAAEGIGIKANFDKDIHNGNLPEDKIVCALEKEFKEKYVPFYLPTLLVDQLRGLLTNRGYTGPEQEGYAVGVAGRIAEQIKCYLSKEIVEGMDWKDFFITNENDDFNIVIYDLNWKIIRKCFFQTLSHERYFTQQPSQEAIHNLLDCACFSNLFSTDNDLLGIESKCFNSNSILQLKKIKTEFPGFWRKLRLGFQSNPDLRKNLLLLFSELEKAPLNFSTLETIVSLFDLDLISLINDGSLLDSSAKLIQKETNNYNTLMLAASSSSNGLNCLLNFIAEHPTLIDKATLQQMFLQINRDGWNALMLAAASSSNGLNCLLKFIAEHPTLIDKVTLQQMLLQKITNVHNILKQLSMFLLLLNPFLVLNPFLARGINLDLRKLRFAIESNGWNALILATHYQPEGLNVMLKFAAEHSDLFDEETLKQIMAKNTGYGWNFFIMKALLEKYLDRKAQGITHTTTFPTGFFTYNSGYSTQEKEIAAFKLKEILETGLEEPDLLKNLGSLKQSHSSALSNGRLGCLFDLCYKIASDETAVVKVRNIIKESREESSMILRQNP